MSVVERLRRFLGLPPRPSALVRRAFEPDNFEARRRHHQFGHRNGLTTCDHDDPLCRRYGCPDDPEWKGDR